VAEEGELDGGRLRALPSATALAELRTLPGIGPFSAELVLARGAGEPDLFPEHAGRLAAAMRERYDLTDPRPERLRAIAERWRPFRSWVSLLLRADWDERRAAPVPSRPG
jgi:DNA-3-methyladenine glycosylase II